MTLYPLYREKTTVEPRGRAPAGLHPISDRHTRGQRAASDATPAGDCCTKAQLRFVAAANHGRSVCDSRWVSRPTYRCSRTGLEVG